MPKILEIEKEGYGRYMFVGTGSSRQRLWVPDWARWMAQDMDGEWVWFETRPEPVPDFGRWAASSAKRDEIAYRSQIPRRDWESMLYKVS